MNYNEIYRDKTKYLCLEIIKTLTPIPHSDAISVIRKQIIKSSTSLAANYRAVNRARSTNERYAKICIVVEEADETLFWLEILDNINIISQEKVLELLNLTEEIVKVMASYKKTLKPST